MATGILGSTQDMQPPAAGAAVSSPPDLSPHSGSGGRSSEAESGGSGARRAMWAIGVSGAMRASSAARCGRATRVGWSGRTDGLTDLIIIVVD